MTKIRTIALTLALVSSAPPFAAAADTSEKPAPEKGFVWIFNDRSLDGWHIMNKGRFSVKDRTLFLNRGSGWLRSDKEYRDFELRMDFRFLNKGDNSGIFFRASKDGNNYPSKNYQVQTMDHPSLGSIYAAGLARPKEKKDADLLKKTMKPAGEWQSYAITVKGGRVEVKLNGQVITVADGLADVPGYIGIQGEGGQFEFKNIRIKEMNRGNGD
jgi:hypothetical protein